MSERDVCPHPSEMTLRSPNMTEENGVSEMLRIEYKGELVAVGREVPSQNVFWRAIRLDPSFDAAVVHDRLVAIRHADRVHFEWRGTDWLAVPPAYTTRAEESLPGES